MLTILIPTLIERTTQFNSIYAKLQQQITKFNLHDIVAIDVYTDNRENTIGFKRNQLLQNCKSEYACFLDDDDDINPNYLKIITDNLKEKPDCISLIGEITFNGKNPKKFIHSIRYDKYWENIHGYYRPPNHLNTIKTAISKQVLFPEKNHGEDTEWAIKLLNTRLIKHEKWIDDVLYYYKFIENKHLK